jgi:hypothetical protein
LYQINKTLQQQRRTQLRSYTVERRTQLRLYTVERRTQLRYTVERRTQLRPEWKSGRLEAVMREILMRLKRYLDIAAIIRQVFI